MLSPMTGYALTALAWLAGHKDGPSQVKEIAEATGVPQAYLGKIIHQLSKRGLVNTKRGVGGGVTLAVEPARCTLLDVAQSLDDPLLTPKCMLGVEECSDARACPCHSFWKEHRQRELDFLARTTIADLCAFEAKRGWPVRPTVHMTETRQNNGGAP